MLTQPAIGRRIVEIALHIAHAVGEPSPRELVDLVEAKLAVTPDEFLHRIGQAVAPFLGSHAGKIDADELEATGELLGM